MTRVLTFYSTSIGKKVVMAVTGLILFGYVAIHMLGNLQMFMGREQINAYAATLKGNAALLWGARLVLLARRFAHRRGHPAMRRASAAGRKDIIIKM